MTCSMKTAKFYSIKQWNNGIYKNLFNIYLKKQTLKFCASIQWMYVCIHAHMCMVAQTGAHIFTGAYVCTYVWKSDVDVWCLPQPNFSFAILWKQSLTWTQSLPIWVLLLSRFPCWIFSTSFELQLIIGGPVHLPSIYTNAGIKIPVLLIHWAAPWCLDPFIWPDALVWAEVELWLGKGRRI